MRRAGAVLAALVVALAGAVAVVLFFQSRDKSTFEGKTSTAVPGQPYKGEPTLSPALEDAVNLGNVVVLHKTARPPKGVDQLTEGAGPELKPDGLAVLTDIEPTLKTQLAAVSRTRIKFADRPEDLRAFVDYWLGRK
jgi:hypothetical protein